MIQTISARARSRASRRSVWRRGHGGSGLPCCRCARSPRTWPLCAAAVERCVRGPIGPSRWRTHEDSSRAAARRTQPVRCATGRLWRCRWRPSASTAESPPNCRRASGAASRRARFTCWPPPPQRPRRWKTRVRLPVRVACDDGAFVWKARLRRGATDLAGVSFVLMLMRCNGWRCAVRWPRGSLALQLGLRVALASLWGETALQSLARLCGSTAASSDIAWHNATWQLSARRFNSLARRHRRPRHTAHPLRIASTRSTPRRRRHDAASCSPPLRRPHSRPLRLRRTASPPCRQTDCVVLLGLARASGQQPPAASPPAIPGNSMSALLRGATSAAGCRGTPACALGAWKTRRRFNTGSCTRRFTHGSVSRGGRWQSSRQPCSRGGSSGGACRSLVR